MKDNILLFTAICLSLLLMQSCGASRKSKEQEYVPLHPPVVIPHPWDQAPDSTQVAVSEKIETL